MLKALVSKVVRAKLFARAHPPILLPRTPTTRPFEQRWRRLGLAVPASAQPATTTSLPSIRPLRRSVDLFEKTYILLLSASSFRGATPLLRGTGATSAPGVGPTILVSPASPSQGVLAGLTRAGGWVKE